MRRVRNTYRTPCHAAGCERPGRGRYCIEHLELDPEVLRIREALDDRPAAVARIMEQGEAAIGLEGILMGDALALLHESPLYAHELANKLRVPRPVAVAIAGAAASVGWVHVRADEEEGALLTLAPGNPLERKRTELERVEHAGRRAVDLAGCLPRGILAEIAKGPRSLEQLQACFGMTRMAAASYATALAEVGAVEVTADLGRGMVVSLPPQPAPTPEPKYCKTCRPPKRRGRRTARPPKPPKARPSVPLQEQVGKADEAFGRTELVVAEPVPTNGSTTLGGAAIATLGRALRVGAWRLLDRANERLGQLEQARG